MSVMHSIGYRLHPERPRAFGVKGRPGFRFASAASALADRPVQRLPVVLACALLLWCAVLVGLGFFLRISPGEPSRPLEAQIVELPAEGLAGGGGGSSAGGESARVPAKRISPAVKTAPRKHRTAAPKTVEEADEPVPPSRNLNVPEPPKVKPNDQPPAATSTSSVNAGGSMASGGGGSGGSGGSGTGIGGGTGSGVGEGSGSGAGGGFGSGGTGPRVTYAPVPTIPDDMRDEVMQAVAVARFEVKRDGRVLVSLVTPTDFDRLNDIILEKLRQWRFSPAVRNGVAIDSEAQVRLLITVQ